MSLLSDCARRETKGLCPRVLKLGEFYHPSLYKYIDMGGGQYHPLFLIMFDAALS